jgi:undecaprenyl-diphosphatase
MSTPAGSGRGSRRDGLLLGELRAMVTLDGLILRGFNHFVQWSATVDAFIGLLSRTHLVKGGVFLAVLWWAWFAAAGPAQVRRTRATLLAALLGTLGALATAQLLALALPLRLRPIHEPALALQLPTGLPPSAFDGWSAFPSDHAALFMGLAMGFFLVSRRLGLLGFAYALLVICLPRLYLGLHYPTDILGGALLGLLGSAMAHCWLTPHGLMRHVFSWMHRHRAAFYSLFFLVTYQLATLFDDVRALASAAVRLVKGLIQ